MNAAAGKTIRKSCTYVKPGDSMAMTINEQTHSPASVQVNSYLSDPKDAVTISAQFAQCSK